MYKFRNASEPTEMAGEIGNDLLSIKEANGGMLYACDVVNSARDESSPLHPFFEWDDSLAAEQHRLGQARKLITSVVVVKEQSTGKVEIVTLVFVHLRADKNGYRESDEVFASVELTQSYVLQLRIDWQSFKKKHDSVLSDLSAFQQLDGEIDHL